MRREESFLVFFCSFPLVTALLFQVTVNALTLSVLLYTMYGTNFFTVFFECLSALSVCNNYFSWCRVGVRVGGLGSRSHMCLSLSSRGKAISL